MKKSSNKLRTIFISLIAVVMLSACTPQHAISTYFANEQSTAHRVVKCESGYNVNAVSPTNDHGLFQINAATWNKPGHHDAVADWIGRHWHLRYDPMTNAQMAKMIRDKYGWRSWSCY